RQQRRHPDGAGGNAREDLGLGSDAERKQADRQHEEKQRGEHGALRTGAEAQIARHDGEKGGHVSRPSGNSSRRASGSGTGTWLASTTMPPFARCCARIPPSQSTAARSSALLGSSSSQSGTSVSSRRASATRRF